MPLSIRTRLQSFNFTLFFAMVFVCAAGLFTMSSFGMHDTYFYKQSIWIGVTLLTWFFMSTVDFRFLRQTRVVISLYVFFIAILGLVHVVGYSAKGAQNWI